MARRSPSWTAVELDCNTPYGRQSSMTESYVLVDSPLSWENWKKRSIATYPELSWKTSRSYPGILGYV